MRASEQLEPEYGTTTATTIALVLYAAYNTAASVTSVPAGRMSDRVGSRQVLLAAVAAFALAYTGFAFDTDNWPVLTPWFVLAGIGIGCVETAEHAAVAGLAPEHIRGSAFGLLAGVQSLGNLAASGIAGILWATVSPTAAFIYITAWMLIALIGLIRAR